MKLQRQSRIGLSAFVVSSLFVGCGVKPAPTEEQTAALFRGGPPPFVRECERLLKDCDRLHRPGRFRDACVWEVLRGECGHHPHMDASIPLDAANDVKRDAGGAVDVAQPADGAVAGHDAAGDGSGQGGTCAQPDPSAVWDPGSGFKGTVGAVTSMWSTSSSDVWASSNSSSTFSFGTILAATIQHWNGTTWTSVVGPVGVQAVKSLWASGPSDLWVGTTTGLWRWNGTDWSNVTPFPQGNDFMYKVWGLGPSDVWALRGAAAPGVFHWDGVSWTDQSIVTTSVPPPSDAPLPTGVGFFAPDAVWGATTADVWLAGSILYPSGTLEGTDISAYAHWDGAAWTVESPTTVAEARFGAIVDVRGTSADNIWAVGQAGSTQPQVIEHYDGVSWTRQSNVPGMGSLSAIWGTCPSDFWAVGTSGAPNALAAVVLHFDGSVWTTVPTPFTFPTLSLNAVTGTDANDLWVGFGDLSLLNGLAYHRHL